MLFSHELQTKAFPHWLQIKELSPCEFSCVLKVQSCCWRLLHSLYFQGEFYMSSTARPLTEGFATWMSYVRILFYINLHMSNEYGWLQDLPHWLQCFFIVWVLLLCLNVKAMIHVFSTFITCISCHLSSEYLLKEFMIFFPLWVPSCRLRAEHWLKAFPHSWHRYGFSPVWVTSCRLRAEHLLKAFPHRRHSYGCSPVCVLSCCLRLEDWVKAFPHRWHSYGFSPVWVRLCFLRSELWIKAFPQIRHSYGLSPVWVISCRLRVELFIKAFPHRWHSYDLPLV